jgi:uncharacterized surface protein with fasciclin (FAS1) repeats
MTDQLNLIDTIARADRFSTFSKLLRAAKADEWAQGNTEFTVLAPTNDAFAKLPENELDAILKQENVAVLNSLVSYHIMPGKLMAANLASAGSTKSVSGQELRFGDSNGLKVNGVALGARNIEASNGVVHAIDTVLSPPLAASATGADNGMLNAVAGRPLA